MMRPGLCFAILLGVAGCAASTSNIPPGTLPQTHTAPRKVKATPTPNPICTKAPHTTAFTVSGSHIMLSTDGSSPAPFFIKGVDYSPTQIGSTYIEPLDNTNSAIWQRDLPAIQKLGANVVRVYNVGMYQLGSNNWYATPIDQWLNEAYKHGIYTILEINFSAGILSPLNQGGVQSVEYQYTRLAEYAGCNPDVMGISIGGEWNGSFVSNPDVWTKGLNVIIKGANYGLEQVNANKILTTSVVNDMNPSEFMQSTMWYGEQNKFPRGNFAWGYDVYSALAPVLKGAQKVMKAQQLQRPFILGEWGESVGYHPYPTPALPPGSSYPPPPSPVPSQWVVQEWPGSTPLPSSAPTPSTTPSPAFSAVTAYLDSQAQQIYGAFTNPGSGALLSGGFYFEWSDEWWAGRRTQGGPACHHIAGNGDPAILTPGGWPSQYWDNGWFGLNSVALPTSEPCPSNGGSTPDLLTQRLTFTHLQADFAAEPEPASATKTMRIRR